MTVISWVPNQNKEYDLLFDKLREERYEDKSHRYWGNYHKSHFADVVFYTIYFNENNQVEACSSISKRPCWPDQVYRILNRTWKVTNKIDRLQHITPGMGEISLCQINWLKEHTDCKLYFISRQTNNWVKWLITNYKKSYGLEFFTSENKYLTCPNESDDSCWQHIIYNGDSTLLNYWKCK